MTTESKNLIIKSSGRRTAKGIAIILIVMVVGAAISLAYKDVWSKYPPLRVLNQKQQPQTPVETIPTGEKRTFNLVFKESEDFTQLWFEMDGVKNPDIEVSLGDEITINIVNSGLMPHAFGVVSDPNDVNSVIFNSAIGSANKPLSPGMSESATFKVTKPGEYYYICLVPGHALQGMKGKFIVKESKGSAVTTPGTGIETSTPTSAETSGPLIVAEGNTLTIDMQFKESEDFAQLWFESNGEKNPTIKVKAGTQVTINIVNSGLMPHAFGVVSDPNDVNSVIFNSAIGSANKPLLSNNSASTTFTADKPGEYYYICLVPGHALQGMKGKFIVE